MADDLPKRADGLFSLYIHFPFCCRRCIYCDFNTLGGISLEQRRVYHLSLLQDIRLSAKQVKICSSGLRSLYLGGGTPTLAPSDWLVEVISQVRESFGLAKEAEITSESNPATLSLEKLHQMRRCGINRLSLGVQSLDDKLLEQLGRVHSAQDVENCLNWARQAGFRNINIDLIYGLPGQSVSIWKNTLERLLSFHPEHISCYALSVEEGTPLQRALDKGLMKLPSEDEVAEMETVLKRLLRQADFAHYEISNWARRGYQCFHNKVYWANLPYLGLGAGAVSYYRGWRFRRLSNPSWYSQAVRQGTEILESAERLGWAARLREDFMLQLRCRRGISFDRVFKKFPPQFRRGLRRANEEFWHQIPDELFSRCGYHLRLTGRGRDLSNEIFVRLLEFSPFDRVFCQKNLPQNKSQFPLC
ncbi:MAG: radical SAM family heme chaperone HemW [Candidatus Bruticola sp.]